jgi:hypothetical protein
LGERFGKGVEVPPYEGGSRVVGGFLLAKESWWLLGGTLLTKEVVRLVEVFSLQRSLAG